MRRVERGEPPFQVGLNVLAYNLFPWEEELCVESFLSAETEKSCVLQIIGPEDVEMETEVEGKIFFNRNKGHNRGLEMLKKKAEVLICADVDLLIPPLLIDQTYEAAKKGKFCWTLLLKSIPFQERWPRRWGEWKKELKEIKSAKGPWNGASWKGWKKAGGWNEGLFGRKFDRDLHTRFEYGKVPRKEIWDNPLVHVSHPSRFTEEELVIIRREIRKYKTKKKWIKYL